MDVTYLSVIDKERETNFKNGLYDYLIVTMSYNTNRIEGSTLTFSDTKALYEHNLLPTGGHKVDDIIEGKNHFNLFNFMLDTINEPLSERLIKEFHQLLKAGTSDELKYGIGRYKTFPNIASEQKVAEPHKVSELMESLLNDYNALETINLKGILDFHHQFELIHPFQNGNGRIGRVIMMRECLKHNITPFIISSERREQYINALKIFGEDPGIFLDEVTKQQKVFGEMADPFLRFYGELK